MPRPPAIPLGPWRLLLRSIEHAVDEHPHLDRRGRRDSGTANRATITVAADYVRASIEVWTVTGAERVIAIEGTGTTAESAVDDLLRSLKEH